jgi:hypothetical protein
MFGHGTIDAVAGYVIGLLEANKVGANRIKKTPASSTNDRV